MYQLIFVCIFSKNILVVRNSIIIFILSWLFVGCSGGGSQKIDATANQNDATSSNDKKLVEQIFYNVPSPIEMAKIVKDAGMLFNPGLMNSTKNKQYYIDQTTQALNLGVYGADLSYARIFDQVQESVNYLSIIRELTESLQIPQDQNVFAIEKLEKHIGNRDSLLHIITNIYSDVDAYLKENDRSMIAVMIISGGWIEGNYLAVSSINPEVSNQLILKRIAEQKLSLGSLIKLVEPHVRENHKSTEVLDALKELAVIYEDVTIVTENTSVNTDADSGKTTISGHTTVELDKETLLNITDFLTELRRKITTP